jgi:hypothetical protein
MGLVLPFEFAVPETYRIPVEHGDMSAPVSFVIYVGPSVCKTRPPVN